MDKTKTSKKPKASSKKALKEFKPKQSLLLDKTLVAEVLVDCLLKNDIQTFQDVLVSHLRALSKTDLAKQTGLGRRTLYDLIEGKNFDPRLSTLSSLLSKIAG
jgi:DNA-binding phage protein